MKRIEVKTGFGYLTDINGNIIAKAELPKGFIDVKMDFNNYVEVANKAALDAIAIYVDPEQVKLAADKALIAAALEKIAIAEVKKTATFESAEYKSK